MDHSSSAERAGSAAAHSLSEALPGFVGRTLTSYDELTAANELYERVFDYGASEFTLNPNLLCALLDNGGSAVGIFTPEDQLVGFAYGFAGTDRNKNSFHYSQSAVVSDEYQGRGIGKHLKLLQRAIAEGLGNKTMRWTFDPILTRNAHFNFSTLGAVGIEFRHDYYCRPGTDRVLVEWAIHPDNDPYAAARRMPSPELGAESWGKLHTYDGVAWLPLPADSNRAIELGLRPQISSVLYEMLAADLVLIDCRRLDTDTAAYLAVPRHPQTSVVDGVRAEVKE